MELLLLDRSGLEGGGVGFADSASEGPADGNSLWAGVPILDCGPEGGGPPPIACMAIDGVDVLVGNGAGGRLALVGAGPPRLGDPLPELGGGPP